MRTSLVKQQPSCSLFVGLLLVLVLTACGSTPASGTASSATTAASPPTATQAVGAQASAKEKALLPLMTLVGQPTAKLVTGHHSFEVDGKIKNGDTKQHDIYVQVTLLDASGAIVGSSVFFDVDNVPGDLDQHTSCSLSVGNKVSRHAAHAVEADQTWLCQTPAVSARWFS